MELKKGTMLKNRYEIVEQIGEGGFGNTYKAIDHLLNRFVAIKCSEYNLSGEANILKALENVPHICSYYDFFLQSKTYFLVMRLVKGRSLSTYRQEHGGTISIKELRQMLPSVLITLDQMHDRGILHRDISPGNLIVTSDNTLYLIDFGAATSLREAGLKNHFTFRHVGLNAPEYNDASSQGPWTDVYSLCTTIVYLLTGNGVPEPKDRMLFDPVPSMLMGVSLSSKMQNALRKGLSIDVKRRYESIYEFSRDFIGEESKKGVGDTYSVHYHAKTFVESKEVNQDNFMVDTLFAYAGEDCEIKGYIQCETEAYHVVAIADGVSACLHSELASKAAIQAVSHFIDQHMYDDRLAEYLMEDLLDQLNEKILILNEKIGKVATTVTVLLFKEDAYCIANIGDSPVYQLRKRKLNCLSKEQTVAREKLEQGSNVKQQDFHALSKYLGKKGVAGSQMASIKTGKIETGDIFMLCSDGVARSLSDRQKIWYMKKDGDKAMKKIYATCRKNPHSDNCTAIILKFGDRFSSKEKGTS